MKISIMVNDTVLTATMEDNPTTRDFLSLLPLELTLEDYASTEKIAYLPRKLTKEDAPDGINPSVGDITYYAPWGNMAIFYRNHGFAKGLILLGSIDENINVLSLNEELDVKIDLAENQGTQTRMERERK